MQTSESDEIKSAPQVFQFSTGHAEARWIAAQIAARIKNGAAAADIAVLARAAAHLEPIAAELGRVGVVASIAATDGLLKARVVIEALALMRAALQPDNAAAWYAAAVSRVSRIAPDDLVLCIDYARRKMISLAAVIAGAIAGAAPPDASPDARAALAELKKQLTLTREILSSHKPSIILYELLEQSQYFKILITEVEAGQEDAFRDMGLLNEFLEFVADWETHHASDAAGPYEFLADCERLLEIGAEGERAHDRGATDAAGQPAGAVQLLTVHGAKGLEFETAYIVSMIEGRFPTTERAEGIELPAALVREQIISEDHHTEEERRLAYVAMTRAKKFLVITWADKYSSADGARVRKPSRFIAEAGLISVPRGDAPHDPRVESVTHADAPIAHTLAKKEFSFTQLKTFEKCPYQYWFAHVLHVPVRAKWAMQFGRSVHNALQKWYELLRERASVHQESLFDMPPAADGAAAPRDKKIPDVRVLMEILHRAWIPDGYPSKKFHDEKFVEAQKMVREYYAAHADKWETPSHLEQRFKVVIGGELISGAIDRIDPIGAPATAVQIIDYKTGEPKSAEKISFDDKEQLLLYHVAATRALGLAPKLLTYYYLQTNTAVSFEATQKDVEKLETRVAETAAEIKKGIFTATPSPHTCRHCDYKDICPYREL